MVYKKGDRPERLEQILREVDGPNGSDTADGLRRPDGRGPGSDYSDRAEDSDPGDSGASAAAEAGLAKGLWRSGGTGRPHAADSDVALASDAVDPDKGLEAASGRDDGSGLGTTGSNTRAGHSDRIRADSLGSTSARPVDSERSDRLLPPASDSLSRALDGEDSDGARPCLPADSDSHTSGPGHGLGVGHGASLSARGGTAAAGRFLSLRDFGFG